MVLLPGHVPKISGTKRGAAGLDRTPVGQILVPDRRRTSVCAPLSYIEPAPLNLRRGRGRLHRDSRPRPCVRALVQVGRCAIPWVSAAPAQGARSDVMYHQ